METVMQRRKALAFGLAIALLFGLTATAGAAEPVSRGPAAVSQKLRDDPKTVVLDVRTPEEYAEGHLANAVLIPIDQLDAKVESILKDHKAQIVTYCAVGGRSAAAVKKMHAKGYTNLTNLSGGIVGWQAAGLPVTKQ
jgi:rhodanese-related sulfurtransferase